jgi:hypothetical protein
MQLSDQQRSILQHIGRRYKEMRRCYKSRDEFESEMEYREKSYPLFKMETWGVEWGVEGNSSVRASASRSLRRLEERGLVLRQNQVGPPTGEVRRDKDEPHNTTTHVKLTEKGKQVVNKMEL